MRLLNEDTKNLLEQIFVAIVELRDEIESQTTCSNCANVLESVMHWAVDKYWNQPFLAGKPQVNTLYGPLTVVARMHKALEVSRVPLSVSLETRIKHLESLCEMLVNGGYAYVSKHEDWELSSQTVDWLVRVLRDSYKLNAVKDTEVLGLCQQLQVRIDNLVHRPLGVGRIWDVKVALSCLTSIKAYVLTQSKSKQGSDVDEVEVKCLAYISNLVKNVLAYKAKLHEAGFYTVYTVSKPLEHCLPDFEETWSTMKERLALVQEYNVRSCHATFDAKKLDACLDKLMDIDLDLGERKKQSAVMLDLLTLLDFYVREMLDTSNEVFEDQDIVETLNDLEDYWDEVAEATDNRVKAEEKQPNVHKTSLVQ